MQIGKCDNRVKKKQFIKFDDLEKLKTSEKKKKYDNSELRSLILAKSLLCHLSGVAQRGRKPLKSF